MQRPDNETTGQTYRSANAINTKSIHSKMDGHGPEFEAENSATPWVLIFFLNFFNVAAPRHIHPGHERKIMFCVDYSP